MPAYRSKLQMYMSLLYTAGGPTSKSELIRNSNMGFNETMERVQHLVEVGLMEGCKKIIPKVQGFEEVDGYFRRTEKGLEALRCYDKSLANLDTREIVINILKIMRTTPLPKYKIKVKLNGSYENLDPKISYLEEKKLIEKIPEHVDRKSVEFEHNRKIRFDGKTLYKITPEGEDILKDYEKLDEMIKLEPSSQKLVTS